MKPSAFAYHAPTTLEEALGLLKHYDGEAKILAGGQSLIPLLNFRLARPGALIDINGIADLDYIREVDGALEIGAITRHRTVERSSLVADRCPILAEAVRHIGHFQIRNRGTIGGSIAHADPSAELPAILTALEGQVVITGPDGVRVAAPEEFFLTIFMTTMMPGEILTAVRLPCPPSGAGWSFKEVARRSGDFAVAAVAALLTLDGDGRIDWARVALAGVDSIPVRAPGVEAALLGAAPGPELFARAAELVQGEINPEGDLHGTAEYRREVAGWLVGEALAEAASRAGKGAGPHGRAS